MHLMAQHVAVNIDGISRCIFCNCIVEYSPWSHVAWHFRFINESEIEDIADSFYLIEQAQAELAQGCQPLLWLQALVPLELPDPLDCRYDFHNSWEGRLDITNMIVGSHGSGGGAKGNHMRTRRCGFGIAVLSVLESECQVVIVGMAFMVKCPGSKLFPGVKWPLSFICLGSLVDRPLCLLTMKR